MFATVQVLMWFFSKTRLFDFTSNYVLCNIIYRIKIDVLDFYQIMPLKIHVFFIPDYKNHSAHCTWNSTVRVDMGNSVSWFARDFFKTLKYGKIIQKIPFMHGNINSSVYTYQCIFHSNKIYLFNRMILKIGKNCYRNGWFTQKKLEK